MACPGYNAAVARDPSWPLPRGVAHVWLGDLDDPAWTADAGGRLLDDAERMRASRFRFEIHRARFTVGRSILRRLLSAYTGMEPAAIVIEPDSHGKPGCASRPEVHFNVSHSAGSLAICVAGEPVGIDIEEMRPVPDSLELAERFFSPAEYEAVRGASDDRRLSVFFTCWTGKEAYVKARGRGLSLPLRSFAVSADPEAPGLLFSADEGEGPEKWRIVGIDAGEGRVCSLAVGRSVRQLATFRAEAIDETGRLRHRPA